MTIEEKKEYLNTHGKLTVTTNNEESDDLKCIGPIINITYRLYDPIEKNSPDVSANVIYSVNYSIYNAPGPDEVTSAIDQILLNVFSLAIHKLLLHQANYYRDLIKEYGTCETYHNNNNTETTRLVMSLENEDENKENDTYDIEPPITITTIINNPKNIEDMPIVRQQAEVYRLKFIYEEIKRIAYGEDDKDK